MNLYLLRCTPTQPCEHPAAPRGEVVLALHLRQQPFGKTATSVAGQPGLEAGTHASLHAPYHRNPDRRGPRRWRCSACVVRMRCTPSAQRVPSARKRACAHRADPRECQTRPCGIRHRHCGTRPGPWCGSHRRASHQKLARLSLGGVPSSTARAWSRILSSNTWRHTARTLPSAPCAVAIRQHSQEWSAILMSSQTWHPHRARCRGVDGRATVARLAALLWGASSRSRLSIQTACKLPWLSNAKLSNRCVISWRSWCTVAGENVARCHQWNAWMRISPV